MGYRFELGHANLVAYLTTATAAAPRMEEREVKRALTGLAEGDALLSSNREWKQRLSRIAADGQSILAATSEELSSEKLHRVLEPLRRELSGFSLFALVIDDRSDSAASAELDKISQEMAYAFRDDALTLIPDQGPQDQIRVLQPIPSFAVALDSLEEWPGVLFWTTLGTSAMIPLARVRRVLDALRKAGRHSVDAVLADYEDAESAPRRSVLHLSDLHFGSSANRENRMMMEAHLSTVLRSFGRVVITGDLIDNPSDDAKLAYRSFAGTIYQQTGRHPVVVPGKHDLRILGNVFEFYRHMSDLGMRPVEIDHDLKIKFLCFNSAEEGTFARGGISLQQLKNVGAALENENAANEAVVDYLSVVLVHHHPFPFPSSERLTLVQRILGMIGVSDEKFLEMGDSDRFLRWCAKNRVSAVLHGHKHIPRHMSKLIVQDDIPAFEVTAIGCGSSFGAANYPICYTTLVWDQRSRRWTSTFYESREGGPFIRKLMTTTTAHV